MNSHPPETLNLVAHELDKLLSQHVGPDTMYVCVICHDGKANAVSNIPLERAEQLKEIFAELSSRQPQLFS